MEEGRALGELLKQGWRPKRTIILCALGRRRACAVRLDRVGRDACGGAEAKGRRLSQLRQHGQRLAQRRRVALAGAIHKRGRARCRATQDEKSVWEALKDRRIEQARTDEDKKELRERADLRISALGSGSDYTPFIQHLGIASLNTGFGGEGGGGIYHSIYDTFHWYTKFSDGTFEYGRALSQINGTIVMRLADADVLPFEFTNFAIPSAVH